MPDVTSIINSLERDESVKQYLLRDLSGEYYGTFSYYEAKAIMEQLGYIGCLMIRCIKEVKHG